MLVRRRSDRQCRRCRRRHQRGRAGLLPAHAAQRRGVCGRWRGVKSARSIGGFARGDRDLCHRSGLLARPSAQLRPPAQHRRCRGQTRALRRGAARVGKRCASAGKSSSITSRFTTSRMSRWAISRRLMRWSRRERAKWAGILMRRRPTRSDTQPPGGPRTCRKGRPAVAVFAGIDLHPGISIRRVHIPAPDAFGCGSSE